MTTTYLSVSTSGDDGYYNNSGVPFSNSRPYVELGPTSTSGGAFFRFRNLPLTPGSTASGAWLVVSAYSGEAHFSFPSGTYTKVYGEFPGGRAAPSNVVDAVNRARSLTWVEWDFKSNWMYTDPHWTTTGSPPQSVKYVYETPNLCEVVNELVNDISWSSGDSITFFVESGNGIFSAKCDSISNSGISSNRPAFLIVDWTNDSMGRNLPYGWHFPYVSEDLGGYIVGGGSQSYTWATESTFAVNSLPVTELDGFRAYRDLGIGPTANQTNLTLFRDFRITPPSGSRINGVEVRMQKSCQRQISVGTDIIYPGAVVDQIVQLYHPVSGFIGAQKADGWTIYPDAHLIGRPQNIYAYYGGQWDKWGVKLAANDVSSSGFGFVFSCIGTGTVYLDHVQMRVWHTPFYSVSTGLPLYIHGAHLSSGNLNLSISGVIGMSSGLNLYIHGPTQNVSGIDLFLQTYLTSSGSMNMYVYGDTTSTGSVNLFLSSPTPVDSGMSLYTAGLGHETGLMNLFVQSNTLHSGNNNIPLFVFGNRAGVSGAYEGISLYLDSQNFPAEMNLFLQGDSKVSMNSPMNLFMDADFPRADRSISFYIANSGTEDHVSMFVQGDGETDGAIPASGWMNMFILRPEVAIANLFVKNSSDTGSMPMFVAGTNLLNSGVSLYAAGGVVTQSSTAQLYSHGF